jgi:hypothetical protein
VLRQIAQLRRDGAQGRCHRRAAQDVEQLPGKKVAFTLRFDPRRHALLRACCTAERRSAQSLLIEALDRLVDATPGLDEVLPNCSQADSPLSTPAAAADPAGPVRVR